MSIPYKYFMFFSAVIFVCCKKDIGIPVTPALQTPTTPFVEFRDPFCGNYNGTLSCYNYTVHTGPGPYEIRDTLILEDTSCSIIKSTTTNTVINASLPFGSYGILSSGSYTYYAEPSTPSSSGKIKFYKIRFVNDSVYILVQEEKMLTYRITHAYYTRSFAGKKQ